MKEPHPFLNWPTLVFAVGAAILLPLCVHYMKMGPAGRDDALSNVLSGGWFTFCGVFLFMAPRTPKLHWMLHLPRMGTHHREKLLTFTFLAIIGLASGIYLLVDGLREFM